MNSISKTNEGYVSPKVKVVKVTMNRNILTESILDREQGSSSDNNGDGYDM